jgi:hypothetical protein
MSHLYLGSRVKFDKDGATLTGTIFHFVPDISNGRKHAVIEIEHELPGVTHTVPVDQLTPAPISQTVIFMSGAVDFLKPEMNERRFMVLHFDPRHAT